MTEIKRVWRMLRDIWQALQPAQPCKLHKWMLVEGTGGAQYHCAVCGKWAGLETKGSWAAF